ncbi:PREDICTED: basal body-orientation factor 1-like [Amphimedon queenslandica]|uniref:Basal body-orientation factor 1 n=1 Tax=Amphimedon queenslandica TaxID=400682 RepID=A0A1X7U463_AMPQE|nr:PREDICTED: basal body-orientation factor 1-like [Amphimedon queenslandica]|eukprot:XP_003389088.1 PREDICTED: basal body-orientation factor 1-like [Amphimedon queenslandica]
MPKKAKGKGKGKGKKGKSKGKGKKGKKKGSKSGDGASDKESMLKEALNSAKLWEARYEATEKSRVEYRENTQRLITENDSLQSAINKTEKDTIEVITFLKKKDTQKDQEVSELKGDLRTLRHTLYKEWEEKETRMKESLITLEDDLSKRDQEISVMQTELRTMRDFRRKRAELQEQLETLQETLDETKFMHKQQMIALEEKFFEEKLRLQKEANRRIEELASKAHSEAIANLDEKTRSVYRENITISEALSLHMSEEHELRKEKESLEMANRQLAAEKELSQQMAQGKVQEARRQKKQIQELNAKVSTLEESLTVVVKEFEKEREQIQKRHEKELLVTNNELTILHRQCELQKRETAHIKRLAQHLLDQRTEIEQFFLEALGQVKKEIKANRLQYRRNAEKMYHHQLIEAVQGKRRFPPVRTFHPSLTSTNSIYHDMILAEQWDGVNEGVDIGDLTWEQKEQVLRLLFAKINSKEKLKTSDTTSSLALPPPPVPSLEDSRLPAINEGQLPSSKSPGKSPTAEKMSVFITQQDHAQKSSIEQSC